VDKTLNDIERLRDFLLLTSSHVRVLNFTAPEFPDGTWWLDIDCSPPGHEAHWVVQWQEGLNGFGVSRIVEETQYYDGPDVVLPDFDAVANWMHLK
jgi:hypothetical protein